MLSTPALELLDRVDALRRGEPVDVVRLERDLRSTARTTLAAHDVAIAIGAALGPLAAEVRAAQRAGDVLTARSALAGARDASVTLDGALRSIVEADERFVANRQIALALPETLGTAYDALAAEVSAHAITAKAIRPDLDELLAAVLELEATLGHLPEA